jgi:poly(3-hydroxybutyrate) depolymerase
VSAGTWVPGDRLISKEIMTRRILMVLVLALCAATAFAQLPSGLNCALLTQAHADASAGTPNINHDGTPLPGTPAPDISRGFNGIPRSAQPALTASQRRIWECSYRFPEANADMPYTLFVPSGFDGKTPAPLIVDLHGLNITPLQQILFDGTTDFAEKYGFTVLAPMGYSVSGGWGGRNGPPIESAQTKPGSDVHYSASELSELDTMTLLKLIREKYPIDKDRIFLMGHSMGGGGTYYLGGKYNDIWAGLAPISGAGGIRDAAAAERYKAIPMLIMHGDKDSIVPVATSRRSSTSNFPAWTMNSGFAAALNIWKEFFSFSACSRSGITLGSLRPKWRLRRRPEAAAVADSRKPPGTRKKP